MSKLVRTGLRHLRQIGRSVSLATSLSRTIACGVRGPAAQQPGGDKTHRLTIDSDQTAHTAEQQQCALGGMSARQMGAALMQVVLGQFSA